MYWRPVFALLEGNVEVLVVNAQHMRAVPGHKTDIKDAEWIADLLQHGLLKASFIPDQKQRDMRDLTRYRSTLIQERARVANRLHKLLEEANLALLFGGFRSPRKNQPTDLTCSGKGRNQS